MMYNGKELIKELSLAFGPSGCEDGVRELIKSQIDGVCDEMYCDRAGNLIAVVHGQGIDYDLAVNSPDRRPDRVMICAHMDEVGFMITDVTDAGYLKFGTVGGIDPRVLCGRPVCVGDENSRVSGVIASKAIHLQSREERGKSTPINKMYIDIGAKDGEDARKYADIGSFGTFVSDFVSFGKDGKYMKGKALDDRCGCALMIELMRAIKDKPFDRSFDLYFAFTRCEEIGVSGATVAANSIQPSTAIILESTAVADIAGVDKSRRVAELGEGGAISLADRSTIYDMAIVNFALGVAEKYGIKCQVKKYVSGGNDAGNVQRCGVGVTPLALSMPTRYLHSASNVSCYDDYVAMRELVEAMLRDWRFYK
ncbi:MAG: M20/M25/M40 family metallo-hydrolase [Clostridia bacterium]|nr:M20/M25/M40 family metallo-hydrolase [Clostridia bacterium]